MTPRRWSLARVLRRRLLVAVGLLWTAAAIVATVAVRHELNAVLDTALLSLAEQIPLQEDKWMSELPPSLPVVPVEARTLPVGRTTRTAELSGGTVTASWKCSATPKPAATPIAKKPQATRIQPMIPRRRIVANLRQRLKRGELFVKRALAGRVHTNARHLFLTLRTSAALASGRRKTFVRAGANPHPSKPAPHTRR